MKMLLMWSWKFEKKKKKKKKEPKIGRHYEMNGLSRLTQACCDGGARYKTHR